MPGFPTHIVGTPTIRGKARRYEGSRGNKDRSTSGEILLVTMPMEMLPTRITMQEHAELTAMTFWMSAGDHFLVMTRARKFWKPPEDAGS